VQIIYFLLAIGAGSLSTMQAGVNSQLRLVIGPLWTVCVSLAVSVVVTALVLLIARVPAPDRALMMSAPPWIWTGGLCGIVFVLAGTVLAPKLGASPYTAALIAGQLFCSVLLDQFGILGFAKHSVNLERLLGIMLLTAGVLLIRRS
jgi:transporter family-2 protein